MHSQLTALLPGCCQALRPLTARLPLPPPKKQNSAAPASPTAPPAASTARNGGRGEWSAGAASAQRADGKRRWRPAPPARCSAASPSGARRSLRGSGLPQGLGAPSAARRSHSGLGLPQGLPRRSGARGSRRREMEGAGPPHPAAFPLRGGPGAAPHTPLLGNNCRGKGWAQIPPKNCQRGVWRPSTGAGVRACRSVDLLEIILLKSPYSLQP